MRNLREKTPTRAEALQLVNQKRKKILEHVLRRYSCWWFYDEGRGGGMRSVSLIKVWDNTMGFPIYFILSLFNELNDPRSRRILVARRKRLIKWIPAQIRYKVFASCFRIQSHAERPYRPTRDNSDVNNIHLTSLFVVSLQARIF